MKKPIGFRTTSHQAFIYSPFRNQVLLSHPVLFYFFELESAGRSPESLIKSLKNRKTFSLPGGSRFPVSELRHQWRKYRFLQRNGFFRIPRPINLEGSLNPARVRSNIPGIRQVIFETTEECNLDCTYCTYSKFYNNRERGKRRINTEDARKTLDTILEVRDPGAGSLAISFYGGEPLRNFRFVKDIVSYLKPAFTDRFPITFNLTTNGLLLARHAAFLAEHDFEITVSLDGDELANSFRVLPGNKPSYPLVIRNLDHLRKNLPEYFEKRVSFLSVLHNRNSFTSVNSFIFEKYGKIPLTSVISTVNLDDKHKKEFSDTFLSGTKANPQDKAILDRLFTRHPGVKELENTIGKYTGNVFRNHFQVITRVNGNEGSRRFVPTATCSPFSLRVFLSADGTLLPCEHISREFAIGRAEKGEVSIDPDTIAGLFNGAFDRIRSLCNRCFLADNCKECVFNTAFGSGDPECELFLDEERFKTMLARNFSLAEFDFPLYLRLLKEGYHE